MASEIRVDTSKNASGLCTVTYSNTGAVLSGITTGTFSGDITGDVTGSSSGNAVLTGSTNNQVVTVTGANAIQGESNFTYDGSTLAVTGDVTMTNTSSNPQLALISANNGISEIQFGDGADAVRGNIIYRAGTAGDALCFNGYNNTERMRITSSGIVGINSTSPSGAQLVIKNSDDSNLNAISIFNDNGNMSSSLSQDSNGAGSYLQKDNAGTIKTFIRSYNSSYLLGGNIGIGTNSPEGKIHVYSTERYVQELEAQTGITAGTTSGTIYRQQYTTTAGSSRRMGFFGIKRTHGTGDQRANFVMELCPDNSTNVNLSSPNANTTAFEFKPSGQIWVKSGGGIDFSATGDGSGTSTSELFDDYEEGTWLPTLAFGGGSTGLTYNSRSGSYVKIGSYVYCVGQLDLSAKGSSTGNAVFGSLPYTAGDHVSGSSHEGSGSITWWQHMGTNLNYPTSFWVSESTTGSTIYQGNGSAVANLTHSDFNNNSQFRFVVHYRTAT